MSTNKLLHDFLVGMEREKNKSVCFVVSAGKIKGNFECYDLSHGTVTISVPIFSDMVVGTKLTILTETILAWGQ